MREAEPGISERRRLCRILLGLDDQPAAIVRRRQGRKHRAKIDAAVARHGKDAVENCGEKARIAGTDASEDVAPHILAVDVRDAVSVTPGEDGRIDAGKGQVPGVEKQGDTVARRRHQAVDFRLAFDHSSDVVVVDEADPAPRQALGKVGQPAAEIAPAAIAEPRAAG